MKGTKNLENRDEIVLAENSYRMLHKLIKSGMWKMYCDTNFQIVRVEWSDELRQMVGYTDINDFPDLLESWSNLLHPEDYDRVMDGIAPVLQDRTGNTIFDQEYRLNTRDRGYQWFRATGDVSRREDGTPYCFFGVFFDINDQKEHDELERARDEALKKANNALTAMNLLHESMGSGAWYHYFDTSGTPIAIEWSDAFCGLLGYDRKEELPNDQTIFLERVHPEDLPAMSRRYRDIIHDRTGTVVYDVECRVLTKDKGYRWFRSTGRMTRREDGTPEVFYGMFMDIDERKKMNEALAWRDTLSDIMTQSLDSVYIIMDKRNRASVYVSPSIEPIFGISKDIPHPLLEVQKREADVTDDFSVQALIDLPEGESLVQDCWIVPVGSTVPKMFQKTVYHVIRGRQDLLVFEFADHTHEQEIRRSIEDALTIAKNANAAKSSFLSNMSHDIRTPMNVIMGISDLMEYELHNPAKMEEYIQKIKTSSRHLLGLINDVLDMSKIESGETRLNTEKIDLMDEIREIDTLIRPQTVEHHQQFEIKTHQIRHRRIEGDALRIRQVFINILGNAVKYTKDGGEILFSITELPCTSKACAKYRFIVRDNGRGMKAEYLKRIFEPFTRQEDSVTNRIQGTGLGMAITKNIIDMMGGSIRVFSTEGKGSTFEVVLELRIDREADIDTQAAGKRSGTKNAPGEAEKLEENAVPDLQGLHFLCAEDNELNAEILQSMLEMAGASCVIYQNGAELVKAFETVLPGEYDMILMDVQMPVMNGYEATRALRSGSNPLGRVIPIIAMTANAFADDIQQSLDAGMNAHISKPMDLQMLQKTVRTVLAK